MTSIVEDLMMALMSVDQWSRLLRQHQARLFRRLRFLSLKTQFQSEIPYVQGQWEQMGLGVFSGSLGPSQEERWSSYCRESFNQNLVQSKYLDEVVPRRLDSLAFRTTTQMGLDKPGELPAKEEPTQEGSKLGEAIRVKPASGW